MADKNRRFVVFGVLALTICIFFFIRAFLHIQPKHVRLRASAGSMQGKRFEILTALTQIALSEDIAIQAQPTQGSQETVNQIDANKLDVGLIQGDIPLMDNVRIVAIFGEEQLHLLVKRPLAEEIKQHGLVALRRHTINLSEEKSGTRMLALDVLKHCDLDYDKDYTAGHHRYKDLLILSPRHLCDAIFTVSLIKSPVAERLISECDYELVNIPFGDAIHKADIASMPTTIPAQSYGARQPKEIKTIGTPLYFVASSKTSSDAVARLARGVFSSNFSQRTKLPVLDVEHTLNSNLSLHEGVHEYYNGTKLVLGYTKDQFISILFGSLGLVLGIVSLWMGAKKQQAAP